MRAVLAVARLLLAEMRGRRTWVPGVLIVAIAFFAPLFGERTGTGSLRERYHLCVTYGIGLPAFLINLLMITVAAGMARDIENRRIQALVTKPIAPWQIVLGLFGCLLLVSGLLSMVIFTLFSGRVAELRDPSGRVADPVQLSIQRLLVPRAQLGPELKTLDPDLVRAMVESMRSESQGVHEVRRAELEKRALKLLRSLQLRPGEAADFVFRGLQETSAIARDGLLLRFVVHSLKPWEVGRVSLQWEAGEGSLGVQVRSNLVPHGVPAEVLLPGSVVGKDGTLRLRARNVEAADSGVTVVLNPERVHVLPPQGSFFANEVAALWLVVSRSALLLAVALFASSLFRFATAVFLALFVYVSALASGFLKETFELFQGDSHLGGLSDHVAGWASRLGALALSVLPDLSRLDPLDRLALGRVIGPGELVVETAWIAAESAVLLALGGLTLRRRELGKP